MSILDRFNDEPFHYENGFYLTSDVSRIGKLLAHYELYKKITNLPGAVVEFGVFKGASLIQFASFRNLIESQFSRQVIGFDIFGEFPDTNFKDDFKYLENFKRSAGSESVSEEELRQIFAKKGLANYSLVRGDINKTVPEYVRENPHLKIALLHIDTDVYEPAVTILNNMYDMVIRGGLIVLDDYGTFPGETRAVDEFFENKNISINKLSLSHIPAYIVKP